MPAWYDDVPRLWSDPGDFFPAAHHTDDDRLNAIVRLIAYGSLAAAAVGGNPRYIIMGVLGVSAVSLAHRASRERKYDGYGGYDGFANVTPRTVQPRTGRCSPPTYDNPFMNATVGALAEDPARPPACPYDSVSDKVWEGFDQGLFKAVEDVYDVQNSQRQFYTMPVTTSAPDTIAFANFCYGPARRTCKESPERCAPRALR